MDRQGESLCLGANEEEASGNPSGLAATILRAAFRSRIYVSNRETYPALTKALQKGGVHIHPHMTVPTDVLCYYLLFDIRSSMQKARSRFHVQAKRRGLVRSIQIVHRILEIGPFGNPTIRGNNVSYFDFLGTDEFRARAVEHQHDPEAVPHVDFVSPNGDLLVVNGSFDNVFSAHCLEHQPDLISHINQVNELLVPGGRYYLVLPDKRYCFDHFFAVSNVGDVLQAHRERRTLHTLSSVIEGLVLKTHNRKKLHWLGFHGRPSWKLENIGKIEQTLNLFESANVGYINVHAWQFIPASFLALMSQLHDLGMTALRPVQVCATPFGRREFTAILQKNQN